MHCTSSAAFVAHDSAHHGNCAVVNAPTGGASAARESARSALRRAWGEVRRRERGGMALASFGRR